MTTPTGPPTPADGIAPLRPGPAEPSSVEGASSRHDAIRIGERTEPVDPDHAALSALRQVDPDQVRQLHDRLTRQAEDAGLLDVAYRTIETPIGSLLLAATPVGLVRLAFACEDHEAVLSMLAQRLSPRVLHSPARLEEPADQIQDYLAGARTRFTAPVDLSLVTGFRRRVIEHLAGIDYGRTESYAQIAAAVGSARAVRAVGSACATNPLPLLLPCHRVLRSDGSLGGYRGGLAIKEALLAMERSKA